MTYGVSQELRPILQDLIKELILMHPIHNGSGAMSI